MSCRHGNHPDACDICDEVDAAYESGRESVTALAQNTQGDGEPMAVGTMRYDRLGQVYIDWNNPVNLPDGTKLYTHAERATVPAEPLRVFSGGVWTYPETGQSFSEREMDEAAFTVYRDYFSAATSKPTQDDADVRTPMSMPTTHAERAAVPEGWKLVPAEPTQRMLRAGNIYATAKNIYRIMLAATPSQPAVRATVPEGLANIGHLIATQDNRITDAPIFIVQQKRESVGHPDYDNSRIVWVNDDHGEAGADESAKLEAAFQEDGDDEPDGWRRLAVCEHWEFVTACFTEQGCKDYLARNGHNLRDPRIYADGSYRNEEWRQVRSFLLSLVADPSQPEDAKCSHTWVSGGIGPTRCSKCRKQPEDAA